MNVYLYIFVFDKSYATATGANVIHSTNYSRGKDLVCYKFVVLISTTTDRERVWNLREIDALVRGARAKKLGITHNS